MTRSSPGRQAYVMPSDDDPPRFFFPNRRTAALFFTGMLLFAVLLGFETGPSVSIEYYVAVAQVLPIFWIITAVEHRVFRLRSQYGIDRMAVAVNYFTMVAGEVAALVCVATGTRSNTLAFILTVQSLAISIGFVTWAALADLD